MEKINVTRSSMPDFEEYCGEIKELWDTHWLTNMGEKHKKLEENLKAYLKVENLTLYTNGHLALENILAAFCFPKGSEVITTPFTFASTTHAIVRNGLVPVFCDINREDYTLNTEKIRELITDRTVAILPVHVYGNICKVDAIQKIANEFDLRVIYDAAHAFGVTYKGMSVAGFGDASMFSFHATKVFNTIEGGAVAYANAELVQRLNDLKNFGIYNAETVASVGGNAKMSEFQAAMGICNLRHLPAEMEKRKLVFEKYNELLSGIEGLKLNLLQEEVKSNYAYYPVVFDGYKYNRDEVWDRLRAEDIIARKYFYPLANSFSCYKGKPYYGTERTPVAEYIANRVLTLPLYADLEIADVERICHIILK